MNAEQEIKRMIIMMAHEWEEKDAPLMHAGNIDELYDEFDESEEMQDNMQDSRNEVRASGEETGIDCEYSRNYESDSVAAKSISGKWIGWTFWHGGGKHGEPEAIDWMDEAYFLNVEEKEILTTVRTFSKD